MDVIGYRVFPTVGAVSCFVASRHAAGAGFASASGDVVAGCAVDGCTIGGKFARRISRSVKGVARSRALRGFAKAALAAVASSPYGAASSGTLSALAAAIPVPATPGGGRRDAQASVVVRTPRSRDEARELLNDAADALEEADA